MTSPRRALAAGVGGYVGINAAALLTAIEFGLQPVLFYKVSTGGAHVPLYAPFHLSQSIPAMALAHLLVAGVVELLLTVGVITYLQRANVPILRINHPGVPATDDDMTPASARLRLRGVVIGLGAMVALVPLGLLATGGAFGEEGPAGLDLRKYGLRAVPSGLARYSDFWSHTLLPGYDANGGAHPTFGYYASAVIGTLLIAAVVFGIFRVVVLARRRHGARPRAAVVTESVRP